MSEDRWYVVPYNIFGVKLYAVESERGYIKKYCDDKKSAEESVEELNEQNAEGRWYEDAKNNR